MPAKTAPVPILTPSALKEVAFKQPNWPTLHLKSLHYFHINSLEDVKDALNFPTQPHRKTVTDFMLVTQGQLIRRIGLTRHIIPRNHIVFIPAHQIYNEEWMSDDIKGYYCHFEPDFLSYSWLKPDIGKEFPILHIGQETILALSEEVLAAILSLLERLEALVDKKSADLPLLVRLYLVTLLTELKQGGVQAVSQDTKQRNAAFRITQLYKEALTKSIYEIYTVSAYAALLNISPNHLNKSAKMATGLSAHDLLEEMLLLEARVLLTQTELSISEIAYLIKKQDPANFTRFIRKKTGLTPKQYRLSQAG
ncbi:AraC family transcriptional regulator [Spirosoma sp.]|uniref:helix-turn-helix domain-containing protein n=1 Tax=Spirosoma sp. TaxID=1899569 RepID=UPI00260B804B|nr:AraC family transcriptional regulator [Spirosoma sp.]MCX6218930.1 AraC family transcriptional regulator [Spirosoma sp.]